MVEIQLRISLDTEGAGRELGYPVGSGVAFFITGLIQAQLARVFGPRYCQVELSAATGVSRSLLETMAGFAPALQQVVTRVQEAGEAWVDDPVVAEVMALIWPVRIEPQPDGRFLIRKTGAAH